MALNNGGASLHSNLVTDGYLEVEPTPLDWVRGITPTKRETLQYFYGLVPFTHWITRYNVQWLIGDLVAGITVGAVVVPQSMAYAKLANLAPEFGLYSSFMGVLLYWFFATSKDITIGPVAVLSTQVGHVITRVQKKLGKRNAPAPVIAQSLAVICGSIVTFIGLTRLGFIVEYIPLPAIAAFMTGSAVSIAVGQVPSVLGISKLFDTRATTYKVVINILKHLGQTKLDAAMGLTALLLLYLIKIGCSQAAKRTPAKQKLFFFLSTLRTAFVILLYVMISWLVNRHHKKKPKFAILGKVPRGFKHAGAPIMKKTIIGAFLDELPATVIVILIEHISIAKSFGRLNNYTINPSQELIAMGVTNLLGPFLGGFPATGSFSRTAIKAKAGVRTPFAGVITAVVVLLAIYALPPVFFYIPNASLSAVIIHAVGDLITPPKTLYKFWKISPLEVPIFLAGVLVTVFSSIENGIYTTICTSLAILLFRLVKARGRILGRAKVYSATGEGVHAVNKFEKDLATVVGKDLPEYRESPSLRNVFLPFNHNDGSNPLINLDTAYPGIFIYRFSENYNYPNAHHYTEYLVNYIFEHTRRTNNATYPRPGDRPWNDPGPRRGQNITFTDDRPTLKAIILDMSAVNNVDLTSVQNLIDVRNQLNRYTAPDVVEWHFANITNRWTKRALVAGGFGYKTNADGTPDPTAAVFSVAEMLDGHSDSSTADRYPVHKSNQDIEHTLSSFRSGAASLKKLTTVASINRPLFHVDLTAALQAATLSAQTQQSPDLKQSPALSLHDTDVKNH